MSFAVPRGAVGFDAWDSYIKRRAPAETPWTRMEKERSKERRDMITETRRRQRGTDVGEEEATCRGRRGRERERWRTRKEQMMIRDRGGRRERRKRDREEERRGGEEEGRGFETSSGRRTAAERTRDRWTNARNHGGARAFERLMI